MKRGEIVLAGFADAVPIACGMIASVCMMLTAYSIAFLLLPLVLFCVFSALLLSFWMNVPRYGFGFGALFLTCVIMLCVFRMQQIGEGAIAFSYQFLETMPDALSGLFDMDALWMAAEPIANPAAGITFFMMLIAGVNGLLLAFSLIKSKTVLLPLLIPVPMFLAALVYTNLPPATWTIVSACVYYGYVLFGNGFRKSEMPGRGAFFTALAPALLAFGLLILAVFPQANYNPVSAEKRKDAIADRFSPITDTVMSWFGVKNPQNVDLMETGDRERNDTELFSVYANTGTYLLRTHSYGAYHDSHWRASDRYQGDWDSMRALGKRQGGTNATMWIYDSLSNDRIVPYAWTDEAPFSDADAQTGTPDAEEYRVRSGGWRDYGWRYAARYHTMRQEVTEEERRYYEDFAMRQYVMPDGEEKQQLLALAKEAGITGFSDPLEAARAVADYVRQSGTYSLTPGTLPKGKDFVLYFLTESHKGYCVHFASATTAMLQAMGYPARYTIGYYVKIPSDKSYTKMPVTGNEAHAWTEVYVPGVGWVPMESTPGFENDRENRGSGTVTSSPSTPRPSTPTPAPVLPTPVPETPTPVPETPTPGQETPTPAQETPLPPHVTPTPAAGPNVPGPGHTDPPSGSGGAWWLLLLLIPFLWFGAGIFMRKRREARFRDANVSRSIPDMTRYLKRLERFGIPEDPDAENWTLEAVFSNHTMKAEHRELLKRVHAAQKTVYTNKPIRGFLLRWVLFVI